MIDFHNEDCKRTIHSGSPATVRAEIYDEWDRWDPDFMEKRGENTVLNLNDFAKEVHQNAVAHGWWENKRPDDEVLALIHSEWSEALEEYRAGRPMVWFECSDESYESERCDGNPECYMRKVGADPADCTERKAKPEGIAIELIDGCIRILDFIGYKGWTIPDMWATPDALMDVARQIPLNGSDDPVKNASLPAIVRWLHFYTAEYEMVLDITDPMLTLLEALGAAFRWIETHGCDPVELMLMKHNYNKTRPYKHGGKKC